MIRQHSTFVRFIAFRAFHSQMGSLDGYDNAINKALKLFIRSNLNINGTRDTNAFIGLSKRAYSGSLPSMAGG